MILNMPVPENELAFFDSKWYLAENQDVLELKADPLSHYITHGWKEGRNPSKYFNTNAYINKFPEILSANMDPFQHMEVILQNSSSSIIDFPSTCEEVSHVFKPLQKDISYNRIAVFASFFKDGIIPSYVFYYLAKLKTVVDTIIFIADNPILPSELKKLSSFVSYVSCQRHEEYDFGSYKRGIAYLEENANLSKVNELILCNDSCVGPITPFSNIFSQMQDSSVDFYGLTLNSEHIVHLQSYFMVFRNKVINSSAFLDFFKSIKKEENRGHVITKYELPLTKILSSAGFSFKAIIPEPNEEEIRINKFSTTNLSLYPRYLLEKKSPLVKLASLVDPASSYNEIKATLELLKELNPVIEQMVVDYSVQHKKTSNTVSKLKPEEELLFKRLLYEIRLYSLEKSKKSTIRYVMPDSAIVHEYLDGLNGIEIGASTLNPFNLDKTGGYANVDYKSNHGDFWQPGSGLEQAKVNIVASGDDLPFKDSCLDYVLNSHVLEHFFDPIKTVEEWLRVVKPGGYVVMIIPHKERTFDRLRDVTPVQELLDRNTKVLVEEDYCYMDLPIEAVNEYNPLPKDYLILRQDRVLPEGYKPLKTDADTSFCHLCVWDTSTFLDLCKAAKWNVVKSLNVDDKVRNGFMVILQK